MRRLLPGLKGPALLRVVTSRQRAVGFWGLGLLLLNADHFKDVNDSHDYQAGDQILAAQAVDYRGQGLSITVSLGPGYPGTGTGPDL